VGHQRQGKTLVSTKTSAVMRLLACQIFAIGLSKMQDEPARASSLVAVLFFGHPRAQHLADPAKHTDAFWAASIRADRATSLGTVMVTFFNRAISDSPTLRVTQNSCNTMAVFVGM
jgi:hypothetical protein